MNGHDIPCQEIVEMVTDYLEGSLSAERHRQVEEHLAACEPCERYLDQIRLTIALTGRMTEPDLSPRAWQSLRLAFIQLP